jgi:hypothetical protein
MPIGASEWKRKSDTIVVGAEGGGAPAQPQCVVQCPVAGLKELHMKNHGDEDITFELFARGALVVIAPGAENILPLRVGATDQFQGLLANRRVVPGTFVADDPGVPQQAIDDGLPNADGIGQIVDAAAPANVLGTINYETGAIDFTWPAAFVGAACTAGYNHRGWVPFAVPINGTMVAAGGEADVILLPNGGDNYADGINGQTLIGVQAHCPGGGSMFSVEAVHQGDDVNFKLVQPARFRNLNSPLTEP